MNSKAVSCVQAIATAGILMLSTTAFGEDASGVPDSALKGKKRRRSKIIIGNWANSPRPTLSRV
jgi:hypothetical protein